MPVGAPCPTGSRASLASVGPIADYPAEDTAWPLRALRGMTVLPAATALVLGLLYALGALFKSAEIRGAGLSAREVLPLLPVQQLLGRGLAVIFDNFLVLLVYIPFIAWTAYRARERVRLVPKGQAIKLEVGGMSLELDALKAIELLGGEAVAAPPEVAERLGRLESRVESVRREADTWGEHANRLLRWHSGWRFWLMATVGALAIGAMILVFPQPLGVALLIGALVFVVPPFRRLPVFPHLFALEWTMVLFVVLAGAFVHPHPLPQVTLATDAGVVSGQLITAADGRWYVTRPDRKGDFVAIPEERITEAAVCHQERDEFALIELVTDAEVFTRTRSIQEPNCPRLGER